MLHKLQHRGHRWYVPGQPRPSKGPTRLKTVQAAAPVAQVVRARSTQVASRLGALGYCTSCIIGSTGSARQEHTGRAKARGVRKLYQVHYRRHSSARREHTDQVKAQGLRPHHWWRRLCALGAHGLGKGQRCAKIL